jgi:4-hydroxy-3-polyprenylbenzoate decarboxylase
MVPPEVETRMEGPFGEYSGYYAGGRVPKPACRVTSVLYRNNPIIQGNPPSRLPSVWTLGRHIQKAASLWNELDRQIPGVKGVWMMEEASMHAMPVISIKQMYAGHAKQAGLIAAGCGATGFLSRIIVVVDEDIDPADKSEVLWALGTRVEPETSIDVIRGCWGIPEDPMMSPERKRLGNYEISRAIILACKPYHWIKDFPISTEPGRELFSKTKEKWAKLFS